jgi:malate dehydrogenase (oxaloacetate-decarboxylating)(NADP+)
MLDAGCNNAEVRDDEFYLGMKHERLEGDEYYEMVEEFMQAVHHRYGDGGQLMVQFEDFRNEYAQPLLDKYRNTHLCFNDDVQGTGVITTASVIGALKMQGLPPTALADQKFVIAGAGSSGLGVATQLAQACEHMGVCSTDQARKNFYVCSSLGLIGNDDTAEYGAPNHARGMGEDRKVWVRDDLPDGMPLEKVVEAVKPDILLGLSTVGGIFTEEIMRTMANHADRPIIFPLSNPTTKAECTPREAYDATDGAAIFSSGSPFDALTHGDGSTTVFSQCNNMFIFPGVGLGATVVGAKNVTDKMLFQAAKACADSVTEEECAQGQTLPSVARIREVSLNVAVAVAEEAMVSGCNIPIEGDTAAVRLAIEKQMYDPVYVPLVENIYR